jgi:hypothetical protein
MMVTAGIAAALAVLVSTPVAGAAAATGPLRVSKPVTVGRWVNNGTVLRAVDLSGDGIPDLVSVDGERPELSVWSGRGDGSFRARRDYRTAADVFDVAVTDITGDAKPDLIVAGAAPKGPISVLVNVGGGRFRRGRVIRSGGRQAWAVAATDVNRDGLIDLVVGGNARRDVAVLLREPGGNFAAARRFAAVGGDLGATGLDIGDLNGDGNVDLAVAGIDRVAIVLGDGDGTFGPASSPAPINEPEDPQLVDINRDGRLDLVVINTAKVKHGNNVEVLLGRGNGTFGPEVDSPFPGGTFGFAVADIDGDGNLDVAAGGFVLSGRGDGTFGNAQPLPSKFYEDAAVASAVADYNIDGRQDIAIGAGEAFGELWSVGVFLNWTGMTAPPCVVPPLDQEPVAGSRPRLRRAKRLLRSNGCAVGRVRSRPSRRVRKARILEQHPKPGSVLPSHSRVDLVVSRGPRR